MEEREIGMDEKGQDNVAAFDTLFTTNKIQIMKALLPCFDRSLQKYLAIYIKYLELQYTISYFRNNPCPICPQTPQGDEDVQKILLSLLPYCTEAQKQKLQQIQQALSSLETYREMMQMMELLQGMEDMEGMGGMEEVVAMAQAAHTNTDTSAAGKDPAATEAPLTGGAPAHTPDEDISPTHAPDESAFPTGASSSDTPPADASGKDTPPADASSPTGDWDAASPSPGSGVQLPGMDALLSMLSPQQQTVIELLKGGMPHE